MWLVFLLLILLIGIIFSNIEINLCKINVTEKNYNFRIIISLKIFKILKILFIKLDKDRIKILNKRFKISKYTIKKIDKEVLKLIKSFDIKINQINFDCKIGLIDIGLTNLAIVLFTIIFPFFIKDRVKRKNLNYKVLPEYDKFCLKFNGNFIISIKTFNLLKLCFKNIKLKITHNKNKNYDVKESLKYE